MHTKLWSENLRARELGAEGRIILKRIKTEWSGRNWDGIIWLRILSTCGPL
jgi:hypothetical protein